MIQFKGRVVVHAWERKSGRRLWTREAPNEVVLQSTISIVDLIAGVGGAPIGIIGFGSGTAPPTTADVAPLTAPAYYRPVVSNVTNHSPLPAGITTSWSINETVPLDYGATGINVQEIGLFMNTTGAQFPARDNTSGLAIWAATHAYSLEDTIVDANGNVQVVTTAGTSGGSTPTWATIIGNTTTDGAVTWTMRAAHTAPGILFARALMPLGVISPSVGFSATWIETA